MKHKISGLAVSVVTHGILLACAVMLLCQISDRSPVISVANLVILPPEPKPVPTMAMPPPTRTNTNKHEPTRTEPPPKPPPPAVPPKPTTPEPPPQPPVPVPVPPPAKPPEPTPDSPASVQRSQAPAPVSLPAVTPAAPDSLANGQRSQVPAPVVTAPDLTANPVAVSENAYSELSDADYGRISNHLAPYIKRSYSRRANQRGWQGSVTVAFRITLDGQVADIRVEKSSGYDELDECALAAVRKAAPYPPLGRAVHLLLPVTYKLR